MIDDFFERLVESNDSMPVICFHVDIAKLSSGRWRAEVDLERIGEQGLSGPVAVHADTREHAATLIREKSLEIMSAWSEGPFGRPCLLAFRFSDEPDACSR